MKYGLSECTSLGYFNIIYNEIQNNKIVVVKIDIQDSHAKSPTSFYNSKINNSDDIYATITKNINNLRKDKLAFTYHGKGYGWYEALKPKYQINE